MHPGKQPHLLTSPETLGLGKDWRGDRVGLFRKAAELDDVVRLQFGGMDRYLVNHPALIEQICRNPSRHFEVTRDDDVMMRVLGDSVFTMKEARWVDRRKMLAPVFSKANLARMAVQIEAALRERLALRFSAFAETGEQVDLEAECIALVHAIFARIMFGGEFDRRLQNLQEPIEYALWYREQCRWRKPSPDGAEKTPEDLKFDAVCDSFEETLADLIEENRGGNGGREWNLLSEFLALSEKSRSGHLSDEALLDEVKTFFHASTLSTAAALTWSVFLLLTHPPVLAELRSEIDDHVPPERWPAVGDMPGLPLCRHVTMETLRLFPPSWVTSRHILQDTRLGDYSLKAGVGLIFSPLLVHRDGRFWNAPEQFDPHRFASGERGVSASGDYSYIPFGGGARQCLGKGLSMMELPLILATLFQRFEFDLQSKRHVDVWPLTALKPKTKIRITVRNRTKGTDAGD